MAKSKPIGVRFDLDLLNVLKEDENVESPQKALNFLADFWRDNRAGHKEFIGTLKEGLEKIAAESTKQQPTADEPKKRSYTEYLTIAALTLDKATFWAEVQADKSLTPNQKSMIYSKLK